MSETLKISAESREALTELENDVLHAKYWIGQFGDASLVKALDKISDQLDELTESVVVVEQEKGEG